MNEAIWAFAGVVVGAVLTAGLSYWQSRQQRKWQLDDFKLSQDAARDREVRVRADGQAAEILVDFEALEDLADAAQRAAWDAMNTLPGEPPPVLDPEMRSKALDSIRNASKAALYLQMPLRCHVEHALLILRDADQLAERKHVHDTAYWITMETLKQTREMIGRYLRNEEVPTDLSPEQDQYRQAWQQLNQEKVDKLLELARRAKAAGEP